MLTTKNACTCTHTYSILVEKKNLKKFNAKEAGELKKQRKSSGIIT